MQNTLHSKPALSPVRPMLQFEEPAPNRLPFQFLLLVLSVPVAVLSGILAFLAKMFGLFR